MTSGASPREIAHRLDAEISGAEDQELRRLLLACFPYEGALLTRRYIRQAPAHRWLVRSESGELIAHSGLHDKIIEIGGNDVRIGGVAEVCVIPHARGRGIVRHMLTEIHRWMELERIPYAMLFGQPKVYASSGYAVIQNPIRAESGLIKQWNPFKGKPMARPIAAQPWPASPIDLRGPTF